MLTCVICGGEDIVDRAVLWPALVGEWGLSAEEVSYVDRQQGRHCTACGANLRVMVLGKAVLGALSHEGTVQALAHRADLAGLRVLDINGAEGISAALSSLPCYVRADYPAVDAQALPYADRSFDLVLHSDTLEHIPRPVRALEECRRVLVPGGHLCFTVPVIVGRLSRSREGMPPSYHGAPGPALYDYRVETEFGADAWTYVLRAGFERVVINHLSFPAATAMTAW